LEIKGSFTCFDFRKELVRIQETNIKMDHGRKIGNLREEGGSDYSMKSGYIEEICPEGARMSKVKKAK